MVVSNGSGDIQVNIMDREEGEHNDNNNDDDSNDNENNENNNDNDDEPVGRDEKNVSALQEPVDKIDVGDNVDDDVVDLGKSTVNKKQPSVIPGMICGLICCPCMCMALCWWTCNK
jgi:hypothetical protein